MKKIYYLFMVLIVSAMFVACDNTKNPVDKYADATQLTELLEAYYSVEFVTEVSNDYWCSFVTEDIEINEEGVPVGTGEFIYLEVFPVAVSNNFPAGEYTFAEDATDGYAWAGWEWDLGVEMGYEEGVYVMPQGCFVYVIEDDVLIETKYIVSGIVEIKGNASEAEVFADVIFEDGTKGTYYYRGRLKFEDYDAEHGGTGGGSEEYTFDFEPMTQGEYDVTFDVCQMLNNGNMYNTNSDNVELYLNGVEWLGYFDLFAPLDCGSDVYGTYTVVADKYDEWCCVPSSGGNDDGDTPSFLGTDFTDDGYYMAAYYVVSGTVVVAKDGVDIDVTTYNGSKIKGSYDGEVVVETGETQMVKSLNSAPRKAPSVKLVKATAKDVAYFGVLRNRMFK